MIPSANLKFFFRASTWQANLCQRSCILNKGQLKNKLLTCSSVQQTGPSAHLFPQRPTNFSLRASSGSCASPLSGQGKSPPKNPFLPQWPRIAQRPFSCNLVTPCAATPESSSADSRPVTMEVNWNPRILARVSPVTGPNQTSRCRKSATSSPDFLSASAQHLAHSDK